MGATDPVKYADIQKVAAFVDAGIIPAFRAAVVVPSLVRLVDFAGQPSKARIIPKAGTLTATQATEATDQTITNYAETAAATLTLVQAKVYTELSWDSQKFTPITAERLLAEGARAIADYVDIQGLALLSGFSGNTVGTGGQDCSDAILAEAAFKLNAANAIGTRRFVLTPKALFDVQEDVLASGASAYVGSNTTLSILGGQAPAQNGLKGEFFGIPIYVSTNCPTANSAVDYLGGLLTENAIAMGFDGDIMTSTDINIKKSVVSLSLDFWFDVKETSDLSGVKITSKVA